MSDSKALYGRATGQAAGPVNLGSEYPILTTNTNDGKNMAMDHTNGLYNVEQLTVTRVRCICSFITSPSKRPGTGPDSAAYKAFYSQHTTV